MRPRFLLRLLLVCLPLLILLPPVWANTRFAPAPAALSAAAQQPTPVAPTSAPTPTPTTPQLIGVGEQTSALGELWDRYHWGILLLLGLAFAFMVFFALTKKTSEGLADFLYRVFLGRKLDQRIKSLDQQDERRTAERKQKQELNSGELAYLDWLCSEDDLKYLPLIPVKGSKQQDQLLLQDVYVPLRVVEREQMEQFRKLTTGDFDEEGEYRLRQEAFNELERSQRVYYLLSEPEHLPPLQEDDGRRIRRQRETAQPLTTRRLLLVGDAGSGKTTTLHYGALVLARDLHEDMNDGARERLELYTARPLLPLYIRLTLVMTYVRERYKRADPADLPRLDDASCTILLDWLDTYLHEQTGKQLPARWASQRIEAGGCLLLLDGLDETGDAAERDYIRRMIANLVSRPWDNRYLVASRPYDGLGLPGFAERHLSPMNSEEINLLLQNWFGAIRHHSTSARRNETVKIR